MALFFGARNRQVWSRRVSVLGFGVYLFDLMYNAASYPPGINKQKCNRDLNNIEALKEERGLLDKSEVYIVEV